MIYHPAPFLRGNTVEAAKYRKQAINLLNALAKSKLFTFRHKRWLSTTAYVELLKIGHHARIIITAIGGGLAYEFFAPKTDVIQFPTYVSDELLQIGEMFGHTKGRITRWDFTTEGHELFDASMYGDGSFPDPDDWPQEDPQTAIPFNRTWAQNAYQNQRLHEYCWWPQNDGTQLLTSAASLPQPYMSLVGSNSIHGWAGTLLPWKDSGWDIRTTLHIGKDGARIRSPYDQVGDKWWRRACLQSVTHETYGARTFVVHTDVNGDFHIYPFKHYDVGTYQPFDANIQSHTPPWPAWVSLDSGNPTLETVFHFNKDGTKAVTIANEDMEVTGNPADDIRVYGSRFPSSHYLAPGLEGAPWHGTAFMESAVVPPPADTSGYQEAMHQKTGIVEFEINISLTGPDPEDFTSSLTVSRQRKDTSFPFNADYAFAKVPDCEEDDLLIAYLEVYTETAVHLAKRGDPTPAASGSDQFYTIHDTFDDYPFYFDFDMVVKKWDGTELDRIDLARDAEIGPSGSPTGQFWDNGLDQWVDVSADYAEDMQLNIDAVDGSAPVRFISGVNLRSRAYGFSEGYYPQDFTFGDETTFGGGLWMAGGWEYRDQAHDSFGDIPANYATLTYGNLLSQDVGFPFYGSFLDAFAPGQPWESCISHPTRSVAWTDTGVRVGSDEVPTFGTPEQYHTNDIIIPFDPESGDQLGSTSHKELWNDAFPDSREHRDYKDFRRSSPGNFRSMGFWIQG